jgi:bacterioferritin-associated ferredoxin
MSTLPVSSSDASTLVCHCQRVPYEAVEEAIDAGAASLLDVQRATTACTRCFGCRFELEGMLAQRLGDAYVRTDVARLPAGAALPGVLGVPRRRMYLPVLAGFGGEEVRTRVVVFHWPDDDGAEAEPAELRADLLDLDGRRHRVFNVHLAARRSAVIEIDAAAADGLAGGVGVLKLVLDAEALGSLRPYFHIVAPGGSTSTHEKAGLSVPDQKLRSRYFWLLPVAASPEPEEAYFFATNTASRPLDGHALVWRGQSGAERRVALPEIALDQTVCVPLHEHVEAIAAGRESGTVRLHPPAHVAGFILRHDPRRKLWRVQHL